MLGGRYNWVALRELFCKGGACMNKESFERTKWVPIFVLAVLVIVVYKTFDNFSQITTTVSRFLWTISPLLYGTLFAYFLFLPQQKVERFFGRARFRFIARRSRGISVLIIFLMLVLVIAFLIAVIFPIIVTSILDLGVSLPLYVDGLLDYINNLHVDSFWHSLNIAGNLENISNVFVSQFFEASRLEQFARGIMEFAGGIFYAILGLVVSLYILLERDRILGFFRQLRNVFIKNVKVRERLSKYLQQVNQVLFTFIASKGLDSIINLVVVTSILLIFNVQYAFLLGLIAGVFNFIPYLGSLIAVILISLITLITEGLGRAIQIAIVLFIFQQLDANYIEPRIMRSSLKISPILVILAVIVGGAYFGIIGMFLAVPIFTVIKQILLEYMALSEEDGGA